MALIPTAAMRPFGPPCGPRLHHPILQLLERNIMRISNSEIQVFKRCRRRWWFNYYLWLKPNTEQVTGAFPMGTRVHAALDHYYSMLIDGSSTDAAANNTLLYHDLSVQDTVENTEGLNIDKYTKEAELTSIMLIGYFNWLAETGADEGLTFIAAEESVSLPIHVGAGEDVTMMALLDIRFHRESDGATLFMDHKTAQELSTPLKWFHLNEQFLTYDWILKQVRPEAHTDGGMFNFLRKVKRTASAKPPFYGRLEVRHNPAELDSFGKRLLGELRAITSLHKALDSGMDPLSLVYPTPTKDCCWECPYFQVCPMVDRQDGSAERVIELTMQTKDPYERYDK